MLHVCPSCLVSSQQRPQSDQCFSARYLSYRGASLTSFLVNMIYHFRDMSVRGRKRNCPDLTGSESRGFLSPFPHPPKTTTYNFNYGTSVLSHKFTLPSTILQLWNNSYHQGTLYYPHNPDSGLKGRDMKEPWGINFY